MLVEAAAKMKGNYAMLQATDIVSCLTENIYLDRFLSWGFDSVVQQAFPLIEFCILHSFCGQTQNHFRSCSGIPSVHHEVICTWCLATSVARGRAPQPSQDAMPLLRTPGYRSHVKGKIIFKKQLYIDLSLSFL